jgi:hypothetical protein
LCKMTKMLSFPYNTKWYLTHPWLFVDNLFRNIKWAFQRVFRGWDDKSVWDINYFLTDILPPMIKKLDKQGYPASLCKEGLTDEEGERIWQDILNKIVLGFEAAERIQSFKKNNYKEDIKLFREGLGLFTKYFFDLGC